MILPIRVNMKKDVKFIDLFSGMGGIRIGFEQAFQKNGISTECVFTSEIKPHAIQVLEHNFEHKVFEGDITKVVPDEIEDFDFLLAGFPCQAFSAAGNRDGFCDTRGTLFFDVERILKVKKPYGFILENVEGLVKHDLEHKNDSIGRTLKTILKTLEDLDYKVSWKVLDSKDFGLAQSRKRIYITGTKDSKINLNNLEHLPRKTFKDIQEKGLEVMETNFTKKLLAHYSPEELHGKAIKDKRGGKNNIHSWQFGLKGEITDTQKLLLETLFKERRKKHWAEKIGIQWMDGMPLTLEHIKTFFSPNTLYEKDNNLYDMLEDLVAKGYLRYEHPKNIVKITLDDGSVITRREYDKTKEKGYNIVSGKLSFEFSKILDKNDLTPTLVASDMEKLGVVDGDGIRRLTLREGLRLFGYPDDYSLEMFNHSPSSRRKGFDLLGNTVAVPVIEQIANQLVSAYRYKDTPVAV